MAEIFPDEGLDLILNVWPKSSSTLATTYIALFTSFSATTVGSSTQGATVYVEPDFASYARVAVLGSDWGSISAGTGGRQVAGTQKTFPTATGNGSTSIKGFWLSDKPNATSHKAVFAANFDDTTAVSIVTGDIIKVTPTIQFNN